jgi:hypothetical protein
VKGPDLFSLVWRIGGTVREIEDFHLKYSSKFRVQSSELKVKVKVKVQGCWFTVWVESSIVRNHNKF